MMLATLLLTLLPVARPAAPAAAMVPCFAGEPQIFLALPDEGAAFDPVVILGMDWAEGAVPWFGRTPSLPLYVWATPEIPFVGRFSVMVTTVPVTLFPGTVDLEVAYQGRRSNAVPFTIRR